MALNFKLTALTAPPGAQCLTTTQAVLDNSAKYLRVSGPEGFSYIIVSESEPTVDDRDKVWLQLEANGQPRGLYKYQTDAWTLVPGVHIGSIILYSGALANLPAGWVICDGTNGAPDLTANAALWNPDYAAPTTTYDVCPIYFTGHA